MTLVSSRKECAASTAQSFDLPPEPEIKEAVNDGITDVIEDVESVKKENQSKILVRDGDPK